MVVISLLHGSVSLPLTNQDSTRDKYTSKFAIELTNKIQTGFLSKFKARQNCVALACEVDVRGKPTIEPYSMDL